MSISLEQIEAQLAVVTEPTERAALSNALALALSRVDPRRGLALAADAERLSLELEETAVRAESMRVAAWCHETLSEYPAAMERARCALALFGELGDRVRQGNCLIAIGVIAFGTSQFTPALEALTEARAIFTAENNLPRLASACNNIGMVWQELGRYPEALAAYLEALAINEGLGQEALAAVNLGNVSNVYYYLGDTERSFEYDQRALAVARRLGDSYGIAHTLESISSNYKERGEHDAALEALNEALGIFRNFEERRYESAALVKLGALRRLRGEEEGALEAFQEAEAIAESIGRSDVLANARLQIGVLLAARDRHDEAIPALHAGLAMARESALLKLEGELLGALASALAAVGEGAEAYACMVEYAACAERLTGEQRQRAVAEVQARFDVERAEREREMFRLRSEHLEEMMDLRTKELTAMAMRLVRKNAFLQRLRKEALTLAGEHPGAKPALDAMQRAIAENLHGDDEWERFEQEFALIHHDFLERLSRRCPRLTPAELKVCAMLKINLSNKEIAGLLSVSLRNVESHRYSIRKKLGLPSDANLTASLVGM